MTTADRAEYIRGLRILADLLDLDPDLRLPYQGTDSPFSIFIQDGNLTPALALRDQLAYATTRRDTKSEDFPVDISGHLAGLRVTIYVGRDAALVDPQPVPDWPRTDPRLGLDEKVSA